MLEAPLQYSIKKGRSVVKKLISVIILLCICVLTLGSCAAFTEPKSAAALYTKFATAMDSLDSYSYLGSLDAKLLMSGELYTVKGEYDGVTATVGGKLFDLTDNTVTFSGGQIETDASYRYLSAFYDGKTFVKNSDSSYDFEQKLYSVMTEEEYIEFQSDGAELGSKDYLDCESSEFSKTEDGWTLSLSGYESDFIEQLLEELGLLSMLDLLPLDASFEFIIDKDYRLLKRTSTVIFEEGSAQSLEFVSTYSDFNKAEPDLTLVDTKDYTEVYDIRTLNEVGDLYTELRGSDSGNFVLDLEQSIYSDSYEERYTETDTVAYGVGADGFFYNITAETTDGELDIKYKNGVQTITYSGQSQNSNLSESDAKAVIQSLLLSSGFDSTAVKGMEMVSNGVYKFTLAQKDLSAYKEFFANFDGTLDSVEHTVTVTLKDGKIEKIESKLTAAGEANDAGTLVPLTYTQRSKLEIK